MKSLKLLTASMIMLSGCVSPEKNPNLCQLDQEIMDQNEFLGKHWDQKIALKGAFKGASPIADVYKVTDNSGATYVLRDIGHKSRDEKIREIYAQKIASNYGYGPYLYAFDVTKGTIVMSLLECPHKALDQDEQIAELAKALKKMHQGPAFLNNISMLDQIKDLYNRVQINHSSFINKYVGKNKISNMINKFSSSKKYPKTATHRDLHPGNILFTETGVKFIDFENSWQDDPFYDVACIILCYKYTGLAEKKFLNAYFGYDLSKSDQEHLIQMKKMCLIFYGLDLLSKMTCGDCSIDESIPSCKEIFNKFDSGKLSLERKKDRPLLALALLEAALILDKEG